MRKEKKITQFSLVCFVDLMDTGNCLIHSFSIINVDNYVQRKLKLTLNTLISWKKLKEFFLCQLKCVFVCIACKKYQI